MAKAKSLLDRTILRYKSNLCFKVKFWISIGYKDVKNTNHAFLLMLSASSTFVRQTRYFSLSFLVRARKSVNDHEVEHEEQRVYRTFSLFDYNS